MEAAEQFELKTKAFSKLLSGSRYRGGTDQKAAKKRKAPEQKSKNPRCKSIWSSTAVKPPIDDDGEGQQSVGENTP